MPSDTVIPPDRIQAAIEAVATAVARRHRGGPVPVILGVANGGLIFAERLASSLGKLLRQPVTTGTIDISFYRDDIGVRPIPKVFSPTDVPGTIDGGRFILTDDVLQSGRTIRAALEELFAQGRPELVELAVLVDRGGRTLPIHADYTGMKLAVSADAKVQVKLDPKRPANDRIRVTRGKR